jgi:two-component system, NarL family, sensor histidine kinase UhpB
MSSRFYLCVVFLFSRLIFLNHGVAAQSTHSKTDSLLFEQQLSAISKAEDRQDYNTALAMANEALTLGRRNNFLYGEAWALIKINDILIAKEDYTSQVASTAKIIQTGNLLANKTIAGIGHLQLAQYKMYTNKPAEADPDFEKALQLLPADNDYTALCWNERGFNASLLNDLQKQTEYYLNALRLYEKQNNRSGTAMVYSNLSVLYNDLGQTDKAILYVKRAVAIREELKDIRGLSYSYCNISQMYLDKDLKEAEKYAALCTKAAAQLKEDGRLIQAINTSGLVKERLGEKGEVLKSALEVMKILEKNPGPSISLSRQYLAVGIIMSEGRMDSSTALSYINKSLQMAFQLRDKITIRDAYNIKTVFFKLRNDFYNAYENIKKFHSYKDSIITSNTQTNIAELQTKYETEKKDNEITKLYTEQKINQLQIDKLNTEQRIKQLAIEKQNAVIAGNNLLARQKEDEINLLSKERELLDLEVKQQTEALVKQQLLAKTQQQQLDLAEKEKQLNAIIIRRQKQSKRIIIGAALALIALGGILFSRYQLKKKLAEQEKLLAVRDAIAKDLHDEVGSTLSSIKILSEVSHRNIEKDNKKSAALLEKIVAQSEKMQQGMSDIVWAVKPDNDKLEDIIIRMREYMSKVLEPKNIAVSFRANEKALTHSIGMQQRRDLLMIFKEAINNIARHSAATSVTISIEQQHNNILMKIEDNGIGFDTNKITSSSGMKNMKARAEKLAGHFNATSAHGQGAALQFTIPVT